MTKPLISIIIPVYKVDLGYFSQCLGSSIKQTYYNIEIIIVGDGCSQELIDMAQGYAKTDTRLIIEYQMNKGVSEARNRGVEIANGEWILFLDADDWLDIQACEKLYEIIKEETSATRTIDIIQFNSVRAFENKKIPFNYNLRGGYSCNTEEGWFNLVRRTIQPSNYFKGTTSGCTIFHIWDKLFNKEFLTNNHIHFEKSIHLSEDKLFYFDCLCERPTIFISGQLLHYYRENQSSVKHSFSAGLDSERVLFFHALSNKLQNICIENKKKKTLINDLHICFAAGAGEVIIRKYYHPNFNKNLRQRRLESKRYLNTPIVSSALRNIDLHEVNAKGILVILLLRLRLFELLAVLEHLSESTKERQQ